MLFTNISLFLFSEERQVKKIFTMKKVGETPFSVLIRTNWTPGIYVADYFILTVNILFNSLKNFKANEPVVESVAEAASNPTPGSAKVRPFLFVMCYNCSWLSL